MVLTNLLAERKCTKFSENKARGKTSEFCTNTKVYDFKHSATGTSLEQKWELSFFLAPFDGAGLTSLKLASISLLISDIGVTAHFDPRAFLN